jgi:NAD/NADP transhydrogenase alpha subunit
LIDMETFIAIYIFMLAAFTGFEVISKVPAILHTPLMSGSNFIHGVVLVGAIIALGMAETNLEKHDWIFWCSFSFWQCCWWLCCNRKEC